MNPTVSDQQTNNNHSELETRYLPLGVKLLADALIASAVSKGLKKTGAGGIASDIGGLAAGAIAGNIAANTVKTHIGRIGGVAAPTETYTTVKVHVGSVNLALPMREKITKGAFEHSIRRTSEADHKPILALVDHDRSKVIGSTASNLRLRETDSGLEYELDLPDTQLGRDIKVMTTQKLVSGTSIGFAPPTGANLHKADPNRSMPVTRVDADESVAVQSDNPASPWRVLKQVALREISIITGFNPAYPKTTVEPRAQNNLDLWVSYYEHI